MVPNLEKSQEYPLSALRGKVVLVVNTASGCGFDYQLKGFEELYKSINASHPDSFVILGFPSNHFNQEKRTGEDLQEYCRVNHGVTFPILGTIGLNGKPPQKSGEDKDKTDAKGKGSTELKVDGGEALFEWLKKEKAGLLGLRRIKWNYEKFLIGADGKVKERWASIVTPSKMESTILAEVKKVGKPGL